MISKTARPFRWLALTALSIGASQASGEILVTFPPEIVPLYDSDVRGIVDDGGTAGSKSLIPALGDPEHLKGATFNIAFTPTAADLERVTPTESRSVLLFEIGGSSNGFGLYLIDGVPTVLSKQGSNDVTIPASLNDTTLNAIAVQNSIGKLTAGTAYSFSASWNQLGTLELKVKPDGGSVIFSSFFISGTPGNWSGNDTLSVAKISSTGSVGGLGGNNAANVLGAPFDVHNAFSFAGTVTRAVFWNASSVTPPIPTAPVVQGFEATTLPTAGKVRLHWKVTEGGAPNATTIQLKAGSTVLATPAFTDTFVDVNAAGATSFTISATNSTGTTTKDTVIAADTGFSTAVRADSPVAWYRFNEPTGSALFADSAENAIPHDGDSFGQSPAGGTGFIDGAGKFEGANGVILDAILDPGNLTSGGFTVEAIISRAPGVVGANPVVIAQRGSTGRLLLASPSDGKILTDIGGGTVKQADALLNDDAWSHIVIVVDAVHTEVRWYVDGVLAGTSADGQNPDGSSFDPNFILEGATGDWIIGLGKALAGNFWKGNIDEIAVYNTVLDDPNDDEDHSDSRISAHRDAWWNETSGILGFATSKRVVSAGDQITLSAHVGADITAVSIAGIGPVSLSNGLATVTVNPLVTTNYVLTATGPGGSVTRSVSVTALQYQAPIVKGFQVTKLADPGQVRLHWKVSEGEAPNPVTLTFKAGATEVHTSTVLQGFVDVNAGSETSFTLSAQNSTGTINSTTTFYVDSAFSNAVRAASPVAWFRFNEPVGTDLFVDSAVNAAPHDARGHGAPVSGVTGIVDGAVTFDGASAIVSNLILNPGTLDKGFTIETVIRRDAATGNANHALVSQADLNGTGRILSSVTDNGTPRTLLGQAVAKDADVRLTADTWAHLVVVVDAVNTEVRWYLDGVLIGSTLDGANPNGNVFDPNFLFEASEGAWTIGAQKTLASDFWKGQIDEVAIYNTKLDDPNGDGDKSDSRIVAHRTAWWQGSKGLIYNGISKANTLPGEAVQLTVKVGADITSVSVDPNVGQIPLTNGNGSITLNPNTTTTYTVTYTGPSGTFTRTFTVTVATTAPKLDSSSLHAGVFVLNFSGGPSQTYRVRGSTNLTAFDIEHGEVTTGPDGKGTATITIDPAKRQEYFRIEAKP